MNIEIIPTKDINPAEYNPRVITKEEFNGLVESLKTFGQQENLIVNKDMTLISGHQRLEAMKHLGITEAVCNKVDLNKSQEKKLNVLMNSQAISGKFDDIKLSEILEELKLDDDYESLRLDKLEPLDLSPTEIEEDEAPELNETDPPVSKLGEVYQLGRHRVMCGDSTDKASVELLMCGVKADISFTSPPYNANTKAGDGDIFTSKKSKKLYADGYDDNMTSNDYVEFAKSVLDMCFDFTNGFIFWNVSYNANSRFEYLLQIYDRLPSLIEQICWKKSSTIPFKGSLMRDWEPIYLFSTSGDMLGLDRVVSNHWEVSNTHSQDDNHKACFPVGLPAKAIELLPKSKSVLDLFLGSGSTLMACEQTGRTCYGMELDPKYVDVIRKRYWKFVNGSEEGWEDGTTKCND